MSRKGVLFAINLSRKIACLRAEAFLFAGRYNYPLFQKLFPLFQKYITGGFVSEELAGQRVADVVIKPEYKLSGAYWSWGNRQKPGTKAFIQEVSNEAGDDNKAKRLWELSEKLVGLAPVAASLS